MNSNTNADKSLDFQFNEIFMANERKCTKELHKTRWTNKYTYERAMSRIRYLYETCGAKFTDYTGRNLFHDLAAFHRADIIQGVAEMLKDCNLSSFLNTSAYPTPMYLAVCSDKVKNPKPEDVRKTLTELARHGCIADPDTLTALRNAVTYKDDNQTETHMFSPTEAAAIEKELFALYNQSKESSEPRIVSTSQKSQQRQSRLKDDQKQY